MRRLLRLGHLALLTLGLLAACAGDSDADLRVFAASSLTDVMPRLVAAFGVEHPDASVAISFGGSQALATQIEEGAPADLFVSANARQADRLSEQGLTGERRDLARNELVIAVRDDSPIEAIEDLAGDGVDIAMGAPGVPVGELTVEAVLALPEATRDAIVGNVITEDPNVRAVLSRVEIGDTDAAFVYRTDVASSPRLRAVGLPDEPSTTYVVVTVADREPPTDEAGRFLDFLTGPVAAAILRDARFEPIASAQ